MMTILRIVGIGLAVLAVACQGTGPVVDQRPDYITRQQLASTLWICRTELGPDNNTIFTGHASAVIVGSNRLLTNAHFWSAERSWWLSELPAERQLVMLNEDRLRQAQMDGQKTLPMWDLLVRSKFRLVAAGDPGFDSNEVPELFRVKGEFYDPSRGVTYLGAVTKPPLLWTSDWVLIETDRPTWKPEDAAVFHPAATDPDWMPAEGLDAFVAGFSSIFSTGSAAGSDEVTLNSMFSLAAGGPYVLRGTMQHVEKEPSSGSDASSPQPMISYPTEWPRPGGHSGGGVYLWNARTRQPELIGVFHSRVPTRGWIAFLGMDVISRRLWNLSYAPLAPVLRALQ